MDGQVKEARGQQPRTLNHPAQDQGLAERMGLSDEARDGRILTEEKRERRKK